MTLLSVLVLVSESLEKLSVRGKSGWDFGIANEATTKDLATCLNCHHGNSMNEPFDWPVNTALHRITCVFGGCVVGCQGICTKQTVWGLYKFVEINAQI